MNFSVTGLIVWLIVGALAGTVIGSLVKRKKQGFGMMQNLGIGLVGAVIGGGLLGLLKINTRMREIVVDLQDLVAAGVGSLIFLLVIWVVRKQKAKRSAGVGAS